MNRIRRIQKMKIPLKRKYKNPMIEPDQIFLDSKNLPDFDTQQFEGQLERPIKQRSIFGVAIIFSIIIIVFCTRLWVLQIKHGKEYLDLSERNSLSREPIFAARGNIYDRNGVSLAWNDLKTEEYPWGERKYITLPGFSHVLGYVGYPAKDTSGNFWQTEIVGKEGVERMYDQKLSGENGSNIVERTIGGDKIGGSIINQPKPGENITLTIDSRLQAKMSELLQNYVQGRSFRSGSAIMMDVRTGEIIVMTSVPEYDSNIMSEGKDRKTIAEYLTSSKLPLLNRAIGGLFTPGSIVKPLLALEVLNDGVIDPLHKICSCGSISIPNPYSPGQAAVFRDYNPNNGMVDIRHAIAVSSNIFFFETGGGYQNQKGVGIANIKKSFERFGFTSKTGIDLLGEQSGFVPDPAWKADHFNNEPWRIGDTYNTAIGQYGVQITPLEAVRALAGVARRGVLVTPHVLQDSSLIKEEKITDIPDADYTVVQEGMRLSATEGTGKTLASLPFTAGSKTGTAQVGTNGRYVNTWMTTFFPYENPHYALVLVLEHGPLSSVGMAAHNVKDFLDWVAQNAPEYTQ